jgi:hypothetical protein
MRRVGRRARPLLAGGRLAAKWKEGGWCEVPSFHGGVVIGMDISDGLGRRRNPQPASRT